MLVSLLRLAVTVLALETGGVVRDASDVVSALITGTDAKDADDDCLGDHGDCHCPPGCPNCHCSHGVGTLPASPPAARVVAIAARPRTVAVPYEGRSPPLPEPPSVYRPPRRLLADS